jgi:hypothetical protein
MIRDTTEIKLHLNSTNMEDGHCLRQSWKSVSIPWNNTGSLHCRHTACLDVIARTAQCVLSGTLTWPVSSFLSPTPSQFFNSNLFHTYLQHSCSSFYPLIHFLFCTVILQSILTKTISFFPCISGFYSYFLIIYIFSFIPDIYCFFFSFYLIFLTLIYSFLTSFYICIHYLFQYTLSPSSLRSDWSPSLCYRLSYSVTRALDILSIPLV